MTFTQRMVGRPVTVLMIFLIVAALGGLMLIQLSVDLFPEVEPPILAVTTVYRAGPAEVEENVTQPIEGAVANVSGLDTLSSTSSEGSSVIIMEFGFGVDMTEATNDVRDALERVGGALPDDAMDPRILRFDPNAQPVMTVALSGERTPEQLRTIAEDELQSPLERVPGVGQANVRGGREEIVLVALDAAAIEAYGLTVNGVADAIGRQSLELSSGSIDVDSRKLLLRASSEYSSLSDIEAVVVGNAGGGPDGRAVRLGEVAEVSFAFEEAESYVYVDETPSVRISLIPESEANTVAVAESVRATLDELRPGLAEGIELTVTSDRSTIIADTLDQVTRALLQGALLAMAVLLLFLHNVRAAVTIGIAIPASMLATFLAMGAGGVTLNLLSMSGLVLGIGLIVDSSIVVLENIERQRREGLDVREAATVGTQEMISPITASALTTISVFLPLLVFSDELGFIGIILNDISFVIIVAIIGALAVAVLLVPVLASTYLPLGGAGTAHTGPLGRVSRFIEAQFSRLEEVYAWLLARALRYRAVTVSAAAAALIASFALVPSLGIIFAPPQPQEGVSVELELRAGTDLETTDRLANEVAAEIVEEFPSIETVVVQSGAQGGFGPISGTATNAATIDITLTPLEERTIGPEQVRSFAREAVARRPAVTLSFVQAGPQLGAADPVDIVVQSDDLEAVNTVARDVLAMLREDFPDVTEPALDVGDPSPELMVEVDQDRAADLGVSPAAAVSEVRAAFSGTTPTQYSRDGSEWDIVVQLAEGRRSDIRDIDSLFVTSRSGEAVPLSNFATVSLDQTPTEIRREEQVRTVHVTGGLAPGRVASEVQPRIVSAIEQNIDVPPTVTVDFSGELAEIRETSGQIGIVFLLAVFLVFAIMASQFESFRMPFIIFFTIPLMLIGAILIHWILGQQVSMFSLIGLIVLAGIVVNNAIVLVDYTNLLRARGRERFDAALVAGRIRFRPVLMTTFTTILGMSPLAFFPGEGAELTQPVAVTVVGGLAISALSTLFVVPVLYTLLSRRDTVGKTEVVAQGE
jgi:HAE1 family hydrophobic/amphiphilic exporter-1